MWTYIPTGEGRYAIYHGSHLVCFAWTSADARRLCRKANRRALVAQKG